MLMDCSVSMRHLLLPQPRHCDFTALLRMRCLDCASIQATSKSHPCRLITHVNGAKLRQVATAIRTLTCCAIIQSCEF